jgi:retron-type reverse transcriptase
LQRDRIELADLAERGNLELAVWKAARGKRDRIAVGRFLADLEVRLNRLAEDIRMERVPAGRMRRFVIHDPKRRIISAACFVDRVLHHAILNLAESRFERMLTDHVYACRPGKGVHAAALAVQGNLRRWPWLVRVDVDGYFPSIDHGRLKDLLARCFKGNGFLALLGRIVDGGSTIPGRGLPIGALTSQHFANAYLDAADRFLLNHSAVRAELRYMDDIVWWCESRADCQTTLAELQAFLWEQRGLRLKPNVHIGLSRRGLAYCGFRIKPGVILASSRKLTRYRAGLARLESARAGGRLGDAEAQRAHDGLLATLAYAETAGFRTSLPEIRDDRPDSGDYDLPPGGGSL